jgi:hypothetical protein
MNQILKQRNIRKTIISAANKHYNSPFPPLHRTLILKEKEEETVALRDLKKLIWILYLLLRKF